jgi:hypothetical protein
MDTVRKDEPSANKTIRDRHRILKAGKIVFSQGGSVIDCTVRNVSRSGAMLNVESAVAAPQEFELHWDGNVRRCTVVWRKVASLGVKFGT